MFVRLAAALVAFLLMTGASGADPVKYLGPCDVVPSNDGTGLFILCQDAWQIHVMDIASGQVVRKIDCPARPTGLAISPNGATLYVTLAGPEGVVSFVEAATGSVLRSVQVGHSPTGPSITPNGKRLYVCNRFSGDVSVIDVLNANEVARVPAVREPIRSAVTPDGTQVLVANHLPLDAADGSDVACVVTVISTADNSANEIRLPNGSTCLRGICVAHDGQYAYAAHILARHQVPTTQLERGWLNTNAVSIIDLAAGKHANTILLDEVSQGAANPWGVAFTADGASMCVTHAGTHELSVIDMPALMNKLANFNNEQNAKPGTYSAIVSPANDLAFLVGLHRRIRLPGEGELEWFDADRTDANGPRGVTVVGSKAYIAVYFSDKLAVVDLAENPRRLVSLVALGPKPEMTPERRGEMNFHDAWLCFQHWQSCASCHPDGRVDGLNWDLLNDGLGNPKNVKSLLLSHATPPSMASGIRATAESAVRAGLLHIHFSVQPEEDITDIDTYLKSLTPRPSPYLVKGELSEAAKRGNELFFSERIGCSKCHSGPHYTNLGMYDVGSRGPYERRGKFDTPTLIECWRTAPYMHNGHYVTLHKLFSTGKHGLQVAKVENLSEREMNDLVEFVLSL